MEIYSEHYKERNSVLVGQTITQNGFEQHYTVCASIEDTSNLSLTGTVIIAIL